MSWPAKISGKLTTPLTQRFTEPRSAAYQAPT
jgi:hypothetical protein